MVINAGDPGSQKVGRRITDSLRLAPYKINKTEPINYINVVLIYTCLPVGLCNILFFTDKSVKFQVKYLHKI